MTKSKLFIGSSKASIRVARLVANRLEADGIAQATVWDEGIFSLNHGFLERLLSIVSEFDFAVLIWAICASICCFAGADRYHLNTRPRTASATGNSSRNDMVFSC